MLVKTRKLAVVFAVTSATVAHAETLKVSGPGGPLPAMQERDPRSSRLACSVGQSSADAVFGRNNET